MQTKPHTQLATHKTHSEVSKVIYISGTGRSGSTIFDIVLGNRQGQFSLGELNFLPTNGIQNREYCSCGATVPDCDFWSQVIEAWEKERELPLEEYIHLQHQFIRNKATLLLLRQYFFPDQGFKKFVRDTRRLYDILFRVSDHPILIDSSKNPQRILLLRKAGINLEVFHLTRKFSGVLDSNKKELKKNEKAGVERTFKPKKGSYVFLTWSIDNILTKFFSLGLPSKRIKYESFIDDLPGLMARLGFKEQRFQNQLTKRGPFTADHLVAGGRVRMKSGIMVAEASPENQALQNLSPAQKRMAQIIDLFYW